MQLHADPDNFTTCQVRSVNSLAHVVAEQSSSGKDSSHVPLDCVKRIYGLESILIKKHACK